MKNTIYIPIRALGDFTITSAIVKNSFTEKVKIILPNYLRELYNVLDASEYYDVVDTIDMDKSPIYFELHKIRKPSECVRFIKEILEINSHTNREDNYLFDFRNRRLNIFNRNFYWPKTEGNIYTNKTEMLATFFRQKAADLIYNPVLIKEPRVVFFPGSRKKVKILSPEIINGLTGANIFKNITIAYHKSEEVVGDAITFTNFAELKDIILNNDFIIGADSLPLHLAYYFNKPHFGIYNFINDYWLTPYMINNNSYSIVADNNPNPIIELLIKKQANLF